MADKLTLWVEVPAGREFILVKSIGRLISDALLFEIEAKHAYAEPVQFDEEHDAAKEDSFDLGFAYKGTDPETIRKTILKCRADGSIVVHEAEGRGTIYDDNVMRGALTREGLGRLLAAEWKMGLLEECGPVQRALPIDEAPPLPDSNSTLSPPDLDPNPDVAAGVEQPGSAQLPPGLTYWRHRLYEQIRALDEAHGGQATPKQAIAALKALRDHRLTTPATVIDTPDILVWRTDEGSAKPVKAKTVGNALSAARKWLARTSM